MHAGALESHSDGYQSAPRVTDQVHRAIWGAVAHLIGDVVLQKTKLHRAVRSSTDDTVQGGLEALKAPTDSAALQLLLIRFILCVQTIPLRVSPACERTSGLPRSDAAHGNQMQSTVAQTGNLLSDPARPLLASTGRKAALRWPREEAPGARRTLSPL